MFPRVRHLAVALAGAALVLAAAPGVALAAEPWATVNICDTKDHPNRIGLRGSMTGDGLAGGMYMRFRVQYWNTARKRWLYPTQGGDSGYRRIGTASRRVWIQAGRTFAFEPPAVGQPALRLRGLITFQWRTPGGRVRKTRFHLTEGGHRDAAGADPRRFSASECKIR